MALEEVGVRLTVENVSGFVAGMNAATGAEDKLDRTIEELREEFARTGVQLERYEHTQEEVRRTTEKSQKTLDGLRKSATELKSAWELGEKALQYLGRAFDATIGKAIAFSDSVEDLQRLTGESAEETSALIEAARQMEVGYDALERAATNAARKGIKFNTEAMAKLADQYVAIQDPTQRAKFLMDNFGRTGNDVAEAMEGGGNAIRQAGMDARATGRVMNDETVKALQNVKQNIENIKSMGEWVAINIAVNLFQGEVDPAVEAYANLVYGILVEKQVKPLLQSAAAARVAAHGMAQFGSEVEHYAGAADIAYAATKQFGDELAHYGGAAAAGAAIETQKIADAMAALDLAMNTIEPEEQRHTKAMDDLERQAADVSAEIAKLTREHGRTVVVQKESKVSTIDLANAQFDAETAAMKLADAQKALNDNTDPEKQRDLEGAYLDAAVGAENASTKASEYADELSGKSRTAVIDHTKELEELRKKYNEIIAAINEERRAHDLKTRQIIFDVAREKAAKSGGEMTMAEAEALDAMAASLGLVGQASEVEALKIIEFADAMDRAVTDAGASTEQVAQATKEFAGQQSEYYQAASKDARGAVEGVQELHGEVDDLPDEKHVHIYADTEQAEIDLAGLYGQMQALMDLGFTVNAPTGAASAGGGGHEVVDTPGMAAGGWTAGPGLYRMHERGPEYVLSTDMLAGRQQIDPGVLTRLLSAPAAAAPVYNSYSTSNGPVSIGNITVPAAASPYATGVGVGVGIVDALRAEGRA